MRSALYLLAVYAFNLCYADNEFFGTWDATNRVGNDLPGMPFGSPIAEDCQSRCFSNRDCVTWSFNSCSKQCWLKRSESTQVADPCSRSGRVTADKNKVFANPITNGLGADPWIIKIDGWYYLTVTTGGDVRLWRSKDMSSFQYAESKQVWYQQNGLDAIWAPELHKINGRLYIYFAAQTGGNNNNHRMYVLQARGNDPFGDWDFVGKISTPDDSWAIDGTVWQNNGRLYFIWSGWEGINNKRQYLYIAAMANPTTLMGNRVQIMSPQVGWHFDNDVGIIEGPQILVNNNRTFLIYSAASSWTSKYCLGMMGTEGGDPLNPASWWRMNDKPVMASSNNVFGPGHCSFTYDTYGTPWIVYHATDVFAVTDFGPRTVRAEPFKWNADGSPWLPTPPRNSGQVVPKPPRLP